MDGTVICDGSAVVAVVMVVVVVAAAAAAMVMLVPVLVDLPCPWDTYP